MKIAIPSNDKKTVSAISCRAKGFVVMEINNNKKMSEIYLINDHEEKYHSNNSKVYNYNGGIPKHGHEDIVELLDGVEVIIGKKFGPHFSKDFHTAGVKLVITKLNSIADVLQELD